MKNRNEQWATRVGVIFAVMGSAVGLGNFLRFPGLAASYSGGAFMIPYFIAFLLLGLPMVYMEWSMGRLGSQKGYHSGPAIFRYLWKNPSSPYVGVLTLLVPLAIYMYYIVIEGWTLYYAYAYLMGALDLGHDASAYGDFFMGFTGITQDGFFSNDGTLRASVVFLLISFALNFILIYRGLNRGIEFAVKYGIPLLFVIAIVILIRVLTLGTPDASMPERNVWNGLGFMWNPNFGDKNFLASLQDAQMWLAAAGQIFFTLSVGIGVIATYASYVHPKKDLFLSATTSATGNEFVEIALAGMIVIPAAFIFMGTDIPTDSSFQLGFITMPIIFSYIPWGNLFGFLWFFLLFVAALTSSLSFLQPLIAFFEEGLQLSRRSASIILGVISLMGALFVAYFSAELKALDTMDFWVGSFLFFILATIQVVFSSWIFGADKLLKQAEGNSLIRLPKIVPFLLKYVSPVYLLLIFFVWGYQKIPGYWQSLGKDTVAQNTVFLVLALLFFLLVLVHIAVKHWQKREKETEHSN